MFGIGYQEMFVILVAALVIFGPGKLPEVAGQVGRWVRDFRRMTADLTGEFEKTVGDVEDIKRTLRGEVDSITAEVDSVSKSVKKDLAKAAGAPDGKAKAKPATGSGVKPRPTKVGTKPAAAAKTGAAAGGVTTLPVATKADPLADVSFLDDEPPATANGHAPADSSVPAPAATNGVAADAAAEPVTAKATKTNGSPSEQPGTRTGGNATAADAALERARRRRAAAGYNRRLP